MPTVDLILLTDRDDEPPDWPLGAVARLVPRPAELAAGLETRLAGTDAGSDARHLLTWDPALGAPEPERVLAALERPGDLWHAGLRLGQGGRPALWDFVDPVSMLQRDPPAEREASSWRLSLRAALLPVDALRVLGGPRPEFASLDAAALELGHRCARSGVLTRHLPSLVASGVAAHAEPLGLADELRFVLYRAGRRWARWALLRATLTGYCSPVAAWRAWRRVAESPESRKSPLAPLFQRGGSEGEGEETDARVSVLIPTLDRYPYLRTVLDQLARQTVAPFEVVVIDQTGPERRQEILPEDFPGLPLTVVCRDRPGQCSARNAGLRRLRGDYVLFLDDDVEIAPDLVARHLASRRRFAADAVSGVAEEVGAGPLPADFRFARLSDVFPAGNTLLRREALARSGLFDLAYDRGARADADLGMRLYLAGALLVLDPEISVLHHRAPSGGLRRHRARRTTYAASRRKLLARQLPSVTEIYLAKRYFGSRQVREMLWLRAAGTLRLWGGPLRKLLKLVVGLVAMPATVAQIRRRERAAERLLREYPQIPELPPETSPRRWSNTLGSSDSKQEASP